MANYDSPTVIQPTVPLTDMTPLERLLLTEIFDSADDGDGLYFFAEQSTRDTPELEIADLRDALRASEGAESQVIDWVRDQVAKAADTEGWITLDLSVISWEPMFQDIVKRSPTLTYISAVSAFTCSKMRPDGFGGMATVITANWIKSRSTDEIVCALLDELDAEAGTAEGAT